MQLPAKNDKTRKWSYIISTHFIPCFVFFSCPLSHVAAEPVELIISRARQPVAVPTGVVLRVLTPSRVVLALVFFVFASYDTRPTGREANVWKYEYVEKKS